jgi:hypothetical protein
MTRRAMLPRLGLASAIALVFSIWPWCTSVEGRRSPASVHFLAPEELLNIRGGWFLECPTTANAQCPPGQPCETAKGCNPPMYLDPPPPCALYNTWLACTAGSAAKFKDCKLVLKKTGCKSNATSPTVCGKKVIPNCIGGPPPNCVCIWHETDEDCPWRDCVPK